MKVADILKTKRRAGNILSVKEGDEVSIAIGIMVENDTGSVVVYGDDGTFRGMLTFREVLVAMHREGYEAGARLRCGDIMDKEHMSCATPDDTIDNVRAMMTSNHIRYLPVVQDGQLTDVISFYDVARSIAKAANYENRLLKEYIRNWPEQSEEAEDGGK